MSLAGTMCRKCRPTLKHYQKRLFTGLNTMLFRLCNFSRYFCFFDETFLVIFPSLLCSVGDRPFAHSMRKGLQRSQMLSFQSDISGDVRLDIHKWVQLQTQTEIKFRLMSRWDIFSWPHRNPPGYQWNVNG